MIIIPVLILFTFVFARIQKGMFAAFLVLVATKSILDMFWDVKFGPLSFLAIQGVILPFLFLPLFREIKRTPKSWRNIAFVYQFAMSFGLIWGFLEKPMESLQTTMLNVNIYIGFFLLPLLIKEKKYFKQFLLAIMICGVFPILISLYQWQTGIIFQERTTVGLSRYVGFYHDAFPVRFYGLMTLFSINLYQFIFKFRSFLSKVFALFLLLGAFLSIYLVFSKAAVGILGLWVVLLLLFSKSRIKQTFSILIGFTVIFLVFGDTVFDSMNQLFSKEFSYQAGDLDDARYTLAGRGYIWSDYWNFWTNEQNVFFQWFGDGLARPTHNEFLRVLMMSGILGVLFYVIFIITQIKNTFKIHKKVRSFGMMLLGMYLVDAIGLVPGIYYYYNILVWGFFGLFLMKPHLLINKN